MRVSARKERRSAGSGAGASEEQLLGVGEAVEAGDAVVGLGFEAGDVGLEGLELRVAVDQGGAEVGIIRGAEVQEELHELLGVHAGGDAVRAELVTPEGGEVRGVAADAVAGEQGSVLEAEEEVTVYRSRR